jgi:maleate cis-trans isomerase|tara:strand:- start:10679 stop:11458 length:780 start_codon:yes stop_codon:yes gene_type:complete
LTDRLKDKRIMINIPQQITLGWRARIGLLYPETGLLDEEYWGFAPHGVAVFISRTLVRAKASVEVLTDMANSPEVERIAQGFSRIEVDAVAYACTAAGFIRGDGMDEELNHRLAAGAVAPATCTITASVRAMRELGLKKISVATPYLGPIDQKLREFLEKSGFEIVAQQGLGLHGKDISMVPLSQIYQMAKEVDKPESDGVYIACTGFRSLEIIETLEADLGKPVVSANQATMWDALRLAGVHLKKPGLGRLYNLDAVQ